MDLFAAPMTQGIDPGTPVVLDDEDGDRHLVRVPGPDETVEVASIGVLAGSLFDDATLGERLSLGRRKVLVLPVTPQLAFETLDRGPQVIRPKDAARIAHALGVRPGTRVVEGGVGTGAMTAYLASLVGDDGHVEGFEIRSDHLATARGNLSRLGLDDRVTWHQADLADADTRCEAFVVDVPDPDTVVPAAERCLLPGGRLAVYSPLVSQVETVHEALASHAFARVRSLELLERGWVVHERGARPDFDMLGHTGFMTFATRVVEGDEPADPAE